MLNYAAIMGVFNAAMAVVQNVGEFGVRYDHTKVATFQQLWNDAINSGVITGASRLAQDGVYGTNTATALQSQLANSGAPRIPASPSLVSQWWIGVKAGIASYASSTATNLANAVSQHTPDDVTGDAAAQHIHDATGGTIDTVTTIAQQVGQNGPGGTATSDASGGAGGGPIQLPALNITGQAGARKGVSWPWVVGGIGLATLAAVLAYGAMKRGKASKRRRSMVRA